MSYGMPRCATILVLQNRTISLYFAACVYQINLNALHILTTNLIAQDKVAKEGQSGKTAFSQGGVNGPNKLEGLVAYGNLKPGPTSQHLHPVIYLFQ